MGELVELHSKARSALIDEYGELQRRISGYKRDIDRASEIRKEIEGWYDSDPAGSFNPKGQIYEANVGPRANVRMITNLKKLYRSLGQAQFLESCTFPLKELDRLAPGIPGLIKESRSGPRKIEVVALEPIGLDSAA